MTTERARERIAPYVVILAMMLLFGGMVVIFKPDIIPQPKTKYVAWYIVTETSEHRALSQATIAMLKTAPTLGVGVIDQHVRDADGKTPQALVNVIEAAKDKKLPQLIGVSESGKCTAFPCPTDIEALKQTIGE